MIYVIKSAGLNEIEELEYLIKVGFTEDNCSENRFSSYKNHNPTFRILFRIPGCTKDSEERLHYYFKDYLKYGHEWYRYSENILDFFEKYNTKDKIEKFLKDNNILRKRDQEKIKKEEKQREKERLFELLNEDSSPEMVEFVEKFNSLTQSRFMEKMKLLCENKLTKEELSSVLDQIPLAYKSYYLSLGPERCKSLGYNITRLSRELNNQVMDLSGELEKMIYSEFHEGDVILKSEIKEKFREIYNTVGYAGAAKATDLEKYFEIKRANINKKEAFKIIKKL